MRSRERRTLRISIASLVLEELFTSCVAAIRGLLLQGEEEEEEEYFLRFIQVLCRISHSSPTGDSWFTGDWTWFGLRRPSARGQVFANSSTREAPVVVYGDSFPSCEKENWRPIWRGNRFVGLLHWLWTWTFLWHCNYYVNHDKYRTLMAVRKGTKSLLRQQNENSPFAASLFALFWDAQGEQKPRWTSEYPNLCVLAMQWNSRI